MAHRFLVFHWYTLVYTTAISRKVHGGSPTLFSYAFSVLLSAKVPLCPIKKLMVACVVCQFGGQDF